MLNEKLPIDESAPLPAAIRKMKEATEKRYKKETIETPPADKAEPIAAAPEVAPTAPEPAPTPVEVAPTPPPPPAPAPVPEESWEHRYRSMKGRYDQTASVVAQQNDRLAQLEGLIADLQKPAPKLRERTFEPLITDKDREDYGPDLLDVVGRRAKEEFFPIVSELREQVSSLKNELQNTQKRVVATSEAAMFAEMDRVLPVWRQMNNDDSFVDWLALPDRYSGAIRHRLLKEARDQLDTARVLSFFQGFLAEEAALSPAKAEQIVPAAPAPPAPRRETIPLESLAAPGRAKSTAASPPVEKPYITRDQLTKYFAAKRQGKYTPEEAANFDKLIFEAQRDGRILNQ